MIEKFSFILEWQHTSLSIAKNNIGLFASFEKNKWKTPTSLYLDANSFIIRLKLLGFYY